MFQTKLRKLSSLCRIILCLAQENAPGLLQTGRDEHTLLHMCRLSCFLPQMKLVVCVNEISSTALQPWCSRDGDFDTLQQLLLLINIINSDLCITHNPIFQHESYLLKSSKTKYSVLILRSPMSRSKEFHSSISCLDLKNFSNLSKTYSKTQTN